MNSKQSQNAATSLVAAGTVLSGDIVFCKELVIAGTVNGSVMCNGEDSSIVKILEGGTFTGEINAPRVEIAGRVDANVTGTNSVSIGSSAEVSGVIRFYKLAVSPGAVITGELVTMADDVEEPETQAANQG
jgi:cytoskeletal protein CcmA (bactofilin family)